MNTITNKAWQHAQDITLSVLIPFYKDDPANLLHQLDASHQPGLEIILYDDGSQDTKLTQNINHAVRTAKTPAMLISETTNKGRSCARNALTNAARGQWVLFLDADMEPADGDFMARWMNTIKTTAPAIAFGGFSVPDIENVDPSCALHQAFSQTSDCLPAAIRSQHPAKHICTSNLLVHRDVLRDTPFDNGFSGWGWEDVEWAARAARRYDILHIDNPALHLGLESADTLVKRFKDSAANYARFIRNHPEMARALPSWKAANMVRAIPGFSLLRPIFSALARDRAGITPLKVRILALKLWRSSWYAEALS